MFDEISQRALVLQWVLLVLLLNLFKCEMIELAHFLVFTHENIVEGSLGPEYDKGPAKKVKVQVNSNFT